MSQIKGLSNTLKQADKAFNKSWQLFAVISVGMLLVYSINNDLLSDKNSQNNETTTKIGCATTLDEFVIKPETEDPLKTIFQIATIDTETELIETNLKKNEIPALHTTAFSNYGELDNCLEDTDEVIVVTRDSQAKIYPKSILAYHLLINDDIKGLPIIVSRCELCNSYQVYIRENKNEVLSFGVSGLLYKNNDLIFDAKTESLWSQFDGKARVGTLTGGQLKKYPFRILTYAEAKKEYPDGSILSFDTGYQRDYFGPIDSESFYTSTEILGPVSNFNQDIALKEPVIGIVISEKYYAIPTSEIEHKSVQKELHGKILKLYKNGSEIIGTYDGEDLTSNLTLSLWYIWYDFYPMTQILK